MRHGGRPHSFDYGFRLDYHLQLYSSFKTYANNLIQSAPQTHILKSIVGGVGKGGENLLMMDVPAHSSVSLFAGHRYCSASVAQGLVPAPDVHESGSSDFGGQIQRHKCETVCLHSYLRVTVARAVELDMTNAASVSEVWVNHPAQVNSRVILLVYRTCSSLRGSC